MMEIPWIHNPGSRSPLESLVPRTMLQDCLENSTHHSPNLPLTVPVLSQLQGPNQGYTDVGSSFAYV